MTPDAAERILQQHNSLPPSETARAISALLDTHKSYSAISLPSGLTLNRLRQVHKIATLPPGIQWQIDNGKISLTQANEIAKMSSIDDQWLLSALVIKQNLPASECKILVHATEKRGEPLSAALRRISGVHLETESPAIITMPLNIDDYVHFAKAAWNRRMSIADLCYEAARQAADENPAQIADELDGIAKRLRTAGADANRPPLSPAD